MEVGWSSSQAGLDVRNVHCSGLCQGAQIMSLLPLPLVCSLIGWVGNCFQSTLSKRDAFLGRYHTPTMDHWSRLGTGILHVPPCPGRSLLIVSLLQERQDVQGMTGLFPTPVPAQPQQQRFVASRAQCFSRLPFFWGGQAQHWPLGLNLGMQQLCDNQSWLRAGDVCLSWTGRRVCMNTADGASTVCGFIGKE